jgi:hypothetical protein
VFRFIIAFTFALSPSILSLSSQSLGRLRDCPQKNVLDSFFSIAKQGSLYNVLTTPKSYPNIDTLDDLYESRLDIHVRHPGLLTDIFGDETTNTTVGNLRATRLRTTDDDNLNERITAKGDVAGLARYANYDYDNHNVTPRADGKSNLHIVGECPRYEKVFKGEKRAKFRFRIENCGAEV